MVLAEEVDVPTTTGEFHRGYGVSGMALYIPPYRVSLLGWCAWTGRSWELVRQRVGHAFRMAGPGENVYTMAANAVLRLILRYGVDPQRVGYLGLGTESGTDGAAGAVIVKGMLDRALPLLGLPPLARRIELPELKSACLGGVYAVKGALRYLALDGRGRQAIVVSADIALYARGSSGEETQGAGAVAQLLEEEPALYAVDLEQTGSAAEDRGLDFRKPLVRSPLECGADIDPRSLDFPVFNGKYTTVCYIDEVLRAVEDLLQRTGCDARTLYHEIEGVFMHRPYHRLPRTALAALYVRGLRGSEEHRRELGEYCAAAGCDLGEVLGEMSSTPDLLGEMLRGRLEEMVYPQSMKLVRFFRSTARFFEVVERKMQLGAEAMKELGNLYCAALPAWIAAGLEEARAGRQELAGRTFLTIGYGSGDAAEAMLIRVAERWREAASRIGFASALLPAIDLDQEQYALLHAGHPAPGLRHDPRGRFVVDRVGCRRDDELQDIGIEYYCYVPCSCSPDLAPAGQGYGEE